MVKIRDKFISLQSFTRNDIEEILKKIKQNKDKKYKLTDKKFISLFLNPNFYLKFILDSALSNLGMKNILIEPYLFFNKFNIINEDNIMLFSDNQLHAKDMGYMLEQNGDCIGIYNLPNTGNWEKDKQKSAIISLSKYLNKPICNLGSSLFNPFKGLGDILTIESKLKTLDGWKIAICWTYQPKSKPMSDINSFLLALSKFETDITIACPKEYDLDPAILKLIKKNMKKYKCTVEVTRNLGKGIRGSHIVYATNWHSIKYYGREEEEEKLKSQLEDWRITKDLMNKSDGGYLMHSYPIKRNVSVVEELLDSKISLIHEQLDNWKYALQTIIYELCNN